MKSLGSLFRCAAFVSISLFSIMVAYKRGKTHHQQGPWGPFVPPHPRMALAAGQTIVGVAETTKVLRFYIGNEAMEEHDDT